jgi:hypothetical protein
MLGYSCEWCKREKMAGERWIVALAVERTSTSERLRQIQVLRHWSQRWARHPFAVHFCCEEHLEGYVQRALQSGSVAEAHRSFRWKPACQLALPNIMRRCSTPALGSVKRSALGGANRGQQRSA